MPTVFLNVKQCFVCGAKNRCPDSGTKTDFFGPRDLDTRPSSLQRSMVYMLVQRCSACGYCGADIAHGVEAAKTVPARDAYKEQLNNPAYTETANSFLCQAMIHEAMEAFADAGWAAVHGAWVCDDNGFKESAAACRKMAVNHFKKARRLDKPFCATRDQEVLLLADLLRRSGQLDAARILCEVELVAAHDKDVQDILTYQLELIDAGDTKGHTVSDARDSAA